MRRWLQFIRPGESGWTFLMWLLLMVPHANMLLIFAMLPPHTSALTNWYYWIALIITLILSFPMMPFAIVVVRFRGQWKSFFAVHVCHTIITMLCSGLVLYQILTVSAGQSIALQLALTCLFAFLYHWIVSALITMIGWLIFQKAYMEDEEYGSDRIALARERERQITASPAGSSDAPDD